MSSEERARLDALKLASKQKKANEEARLGPILMKTRLAFRKCNVGYLPH